MPPHRPGPRGIIQATGNDVYVEFRHDIPEHADIDFLGRIEPVHRPRQAGNFFHQLTTLGGLEIVEFP